MADLVIPLRKDDNTAQEVKSFSIEKKLIDINKAIDNSYDSTADLTSIMQDFFRSEYQVRQQDPNEKPESRKRWWNITKYFDKLGKMKWFEKAKDTWDAIKNQTKSWIVDLLGALALLAIFDPDGKFITSVINFLSKAMIWIIQTVVKMLPTLIKTMFKLIPIIFTAVKDGIFAVVDALIDSFGDLFKDLFKNVPKDSFLGKLIELGQFIFAKDGVIRNFLKYFLFALGAIAVVLGGVSLPMIGIVAAATALVMALYYVYDNWGKITGYIKNIAINFLNWYIALDKKINDKIKSVIKKVVKFFNYVTDFFFKIINWIKDHLSPSAILTFAKSTIMKGFTWLSDIGSRLWNSLKEGLNKIGDWFYGLYKSFTSFGRTSISEASTAHQLAREIGAKDTDKILELVKAGINKDTSNKIIELADKSGKAKAQQFVQQTQLLQKSGVAVSAEKQSEILTDIHKTLEKQNEMIGNTEVEVKPSYSSPRTMRPAY